RLDVRQLFVDVRVPLMIGETGALTLRVGRQEMAYGSGRFVSTGDWGNVRRSFDAVRLIAGAEDWQIDACVARPVETDRGVFNDYGDNHANFWGLHGTHRLGFGESGSIDGYYFGFDRGGARFSQGTADAVRHTLGVRVSGRSGGWDYDVEAAGQW